MVLSGECVFVCVFSPSTMNNAGLFCGSVDQELNFQDKYLFYRFLDDEQEDAPLPSEEEKKESEEELQDTLLFLSQMGPDAHMRMILRKQYVPATEIGVTSRAVLSLYFPPRAQLWIEQLWNLTD